jgi:competence protein ComEC
VRDAQGHSALLTGDVELAQEAALVQRWGESLRSEVLIVPHHGSHTSSGEAFLAAVAPRVAVMQVGYRNRFGHPHPEISDRYVQRALPWCERTNVVRGCGMGMVRTARETCVATTGNGCGKTRRPWLVRLLLLPRE